ncbi:MAG: hypothetical protein IJB97_00410, partial [Clostridia bacterium]|nr:hypothetical protein [Clostridia bacterium]
MKRKIWLSVCAAIVAALCAFGIVACGEHKHNYAKEVTAPTCTEQGFTTYTCDCGESYVGDYQTELGHQYSEWNISETYHWRDTLCGCEIPTEYMDHTDNGNGICSICDAPLNPTEGILYDVSADGT